jgi:hypothetical protein
VLAILPLQGVDCKIASGGGRMFVTMDRYEVSLGGGRGGGGHKQQHGRKHAQRHAQMQVTDHMRCAGKLQLGAWQHEGRCGLPSSLGDQFQLPEAAATPVKGMTCPRVHAALLCRLTGAL